MENIINLVAVNDHKGLAKKLIKVIENYEKELKKLKKDLNPFQDLNIVNSANVMNDLLIK